MANLEPTISQVLFWGVGDIDECSILATYWAARAAGFKGRLPTIAEFRTRAGRPDAPGPTGLTNAEVWQGIKGTALGTMRTSLLNSTWSDFVASLRQGAYASIAVNSALLPLPYGFFGAHRVGLAMRDGKFYVANPLAPQGSAPTLISEAAIRAAALSFGAGSVNGILFADTTGAGAAAAVVAQPDVLPPKVTPPREPALAGVGAFAVHYTDARQVHEFYNAKHGQGAQKGRR